MGEYSGKQISSLIVITLCGIISSVLLHKPLVIGILPGLIFLIILSLKKGVFFKDIMRISFKGVERVRVVIIILIFISFILPSWYLSGTITSMVSFTMLAVNPNHFFVFCFLTTMFFSMILGTSIGTLSALGVPLISTSLLLQLPIEVTAGAVISGAFVGDRTSPFSGTHQLLAKILDISIKKQGKAMLLTSLIGIIVTLLFFGIMDVHFENGDHPLSNDFGSKHNISFIQFIPPFLLVLFVVFKINIIFSYLISILSGSIIAMYYGNSLASIAQAYWKGIEGLGGGLINMYGLLIFISVAGAYNALLEEMNVIQPFLDKWLDSSTSMMSDSLKTTAASLIISVIAANQTMPIILTGRSFLFHWSNKYSKEELARVMGDTTLLFPAIIPWNVLAIMSSMVINIPLSSYLPYAIFLWSLPCLTILVSIFRKQRIYDSNYKIMK